MPQSRIRMTPARAAGVAGVALTLGLAIGLVSGTTGSGGSQAALVGGSGSPGTAPSATTGPTSTTSATTTTRFVPNELPVIADLAHETAGLTTRISASTSDPDGTVVLAEVRWGDGAVDEVTGPIERLELSHRYTEGDDYRVVVVVQDDRQAARVETVMVTPEPIEVAVVESFTLTATKSCDRFSDDAEFVISIQLLDDGQREPLSGDLTYFERRTMSKGDSARIDLGWEKAIRPGAGADLVFYLVESDSFAEGGNDELGPWRLDLDWPATGFDDEVKIKGKGCDAKLWPVVRVEEPELGSSEE